MRDQLVIKVLATTVEYVSAAAHLTGDGEQLINIISYENCQNKTVIYFPHQTKGLALAGSFGDTGLEGKTSLAFLREKFLPSEGEHSSCQWGSSPAVGCVSFF